MRMPLALLVAALCISQLVAACGSSPAAPTTTTTYDRSYQFSGVHNIFIEPSSRTDAATIMVSDTQIRNIDAALAAALQQRGFSVVASRQQADLILSWYLVTKDLVRASESDCEGCDMAVDGGARYARGTLIVDMTDLITNQPVWRSVLKTDLSATPDSAGAEQARTAAATAMFADFPPK